MLPTSELQPRTSSTAVFDVRHFSSFDSLLPSAGFTSHARHSGVLVFGPPLRCSSRSQACDLTINIPNGYFPIFCAILIYLIENEKRKLHYNIKNNRIIAIGYFVVIRTESPVGNIWDFCPRLLFESKYNFQDKHFATFRKKYLLKHLLQASTILAYLANSDQLEISSFLPRNKASIMPTVPLYCYCPDQSRNLQALFLQ